jgi:hypothetical protein
MSQEGFEPAIPATKRPQTYALGRAATGIGMWNICLSYKAGNSNLFHFGAHLIADIFFAAQSFVTYYQKI